MNHNNVFFDRFDESIKTKKMVIDSGFEDLANMSDCIVSSIKSGGKLMLCGNGGSAADAQHLAAELLVRLRPNFNRRALPAIALALDTSTITACGNDFSFDDIFARVIEGIGASKDVILALSTSGNSENLIRAAKEAHKKNIQFFAFLGNDGGNLKSFCKGSFIVPSSSTASIQESHITAGHALMLDIENKLSNNE